MFIYKELEHEEEPSNLKRSKMKNKSTDLVVTKDLCFFIFFVIVLFNFRLSCFPILDLLD